MVNIKLPVKNVRLIVKNIKLIVKNIDMLRGQLYCHQRTDKAFLDFGF